MADFIHPSQYVLTSAAHTHHLQDKSEEMLPPSLEPEDLGLEENACKSPLPDGTFTSSTPPPPPLPAPPETSASAPSSKPPAPHPAPLRESFALFDQSELQFSTPTGFSVLQLSGSSQRKSAVAASSPSGSKSAVQANTTAAVLDEEEPLTGGTLLSSQADLFANAAHPGAKDSANPQRHTSSQSSSGAHLPAASPSPAHTPLATLPLPSSGSDLSSAHVPVEARPSPVDNAVVASREVACEDARMDELSSSRASPPRTSPLRTNPPPHALPQTFDDVEPQTLRASSVLAQPPKFTAFVRLRVPDARDPTTIEVDAHSVASLGSGHESESVDFFSPKTLDAIKTTSTSGTFPSSDPLKSATSATFASVSTLPCNTSASEASSTATVAPALAPQQGPRVEAGHHTGLTSAATRIELIDAGPGEAERGSPARESVPPPDAQPREAFRFDYSPSQTFSQPFPSSLPPSAIKRSDGVAKSHFALLNIPILGKQANESTVPTEGNGHSAPMATSTVALSEPIVVEAQVPVGRTETHVAAAALIPAASCESPKLLSLDTIDLSSAALLTVHPHSARPPETLEKERAAAIPLGFPMAPLDSPQRPEKASIASLAPAHPLRANTPSREGEAESEEATCDEESGSDHATSTLVHFSLPKCSGLPVTGAEAVTSTAGVTEHSKWPPQREAAATHTPSDSARAGAGVASHPAAQHSAFAGGSNAKRASPNSAPTSAQRKVTGSALVTTKKVFTQRITRTYITGPDGREVLEREDVEEFPQPILLLEEEEGVAAAEPAVPVENEGWLKEASKEEAVMELLSGPRHSDPEHEALQRAATASLGTLVVARDLQDFNASAAKGRKSASVRNSKHGDRPASSADDRTERTESAAAPTTARQVPVKKQQSCISPGPSTPSTEHEQTKARSSRTREEVPTSPSSLKSKPPSVSTRPSPSSRIIAEPQSASRAKAGGAKSGPGAARDVRAAPPDVKLPPLKESDRVFAQWKDQFCYPGVVGRVINSGLLEIHYDDGDRLSVPVSNIAPAQAIQVDQVVFARCSASQPYIAGRVVDISDNGLAFLVALSSDGKTGWYAQQHISLQRQDLPKVSYERLLPVPSPPAAVSLKGTRAALVSPTGSGSNHRLSAKRRHGEEGTHGSDSASKRLHRDAAQVDAAPLDGSSDEDLPRAKPSAAQHKHAARSPNRVQPKASSARAGLPLHDQAPHGSTKTARVAQSKRRLESHAGRNRGSHRAKAARLDADVFEPESEEDGTESESDETASQSEDRASVRVNLKLKPSSAASKGKPHVPPVASTSLSRPTTPPGTYQPALISSVSISPGFTSPRTYSLSAHSDKRSIRSKCQGEDIGPLPVDGKLFMGCLFFLTGRSLKEMEENPGMLNRPAVPFEKTHLKAQIEAGGGVVMESFDQDEIDNSRYTFVVADVPRRTLKYLQALAYGGRRVVFVSHVWVRDCCRSNSWRDFSLYLLPAGFSLVTGTDARFESFRHKDQRPLHGKKLHIGGNESFKSFWAAVLTSAGVHIITRIPTTFALLDNDLDYVLLPNPQSLMPVAGPAGASSTSTVAATSTLAGAPSGGGAASGSNRAAAAQLERESLNLIRKVAITGAKSVTCEWVIQCLINGRLLPVEENRRFFLLAEDF